VVVHEAALDDRGGGERVRLWRTPTHRNDCGTAASCREGGARHLRVPGTRSWAAPPYLEIEGEMAVARRSLSRDLVPAGQDDWLDDERKPRRRPRTASAVV
jgi:hypothetical protein